MLLLVFGLPSLHPCSGVREAAMGGYRRLISAGGGWDSAGPATIRSSGFQNGVHGTALAFFRRQGFLMVGPEGWAPFWTPAVA